MSSQTAVLNLQQRRDADGVVAVPVAPGLDPRRLVRLMRSAIADCALDLTDTVVMTEAASGPYVVTPVLAAIAGAREVIAVTRATRYGSVEDIRRDTLALAVLAGVGGRISVVEGRDPAAVTRADIITNSGHLRPLDAALIGRMKRGAVVPMMFEAWELQAGRIDVDLPALGSRGTAAAGTNERHPNVGVFDFLGLMAAKLLMEAGICPRGARIAVLCDNPFADYLRSGLESVGADVSVSATLDTASRVQPDALLVAQRPTGTFVLTQADCARIARDWPGTAIVQYWGDLDRAVLAECGIPHWPPRGPEAGHMAILPSAVGPEPIVRLQTGGLKVAQVLLKPEAERTPADLEYVDAL